ncbi:MAG TPA: 2-isopropylmalate synthase [candidate division Zixibacteria bacterium]|nr:2-isopropylmalate synthase [candidate division Zixibacteria bacterium]
MDICGSADRVLFFDTSLRDGEQSPGCSMHTPEKLRLARKLESLGVDIIEAGFPVASTGDFEAVKLIAEKVRGPRIAALARCVKHDIQVAWNAIRGASRPRIHTFLATSDIHLSFKLKISRSDALHQAKECVAFARSLCPDVEFSPEDATRSDVDFLCEVLQAVVDAGARTLNIPDTVGYTTPDEYGKLIRTIRERVHAPAGEDYVISVHCHNDLGLAVANSLAGVAAGARQVECTINGIGERAGNAALEEVAMALHVRGDQYNVSSGIKTEQLYSASQLLSEIVGFQVQPNKAIVGRNAFAHEAGIHQHGVLSNPLTYEIMTPESVGVPPARLVLGKHSGRHALAHTYRELGFDLSGEELNTIYARFVELADRKKRIYDQDLISLVMVRHKMEGDDGAMRSAVANG